VLGRIDHEDPRLDFEAGLDRVVGQVQGRVIAAGVRKVGRYNDSALFMECDA
jgi:hypothetical protein